MSSRLFVLFILTFGVDATFKILYPGNDSFPLHSDQLHYWNGSKLVTRLIADQISFIPVVTTVPDPIIFGLSFDSTACLGEPNSIIVDIGSCLVKLVFSVISGKCMLKKTENSTPYFYEYDPGPNNDYQRRDFQEFHMECQTASWVEIDEINTTFKRIKVSLRTANGNTGVEFLMEVRGYGYSDDQNDLAAFIVLCVITGLVGLLISSSIFAIVQHHHFIKPKRQEQTINAPATPATR
ncbi:hypothetical protein M3Y96_01043700 [Aphelenchoides besseyi]|nr:hypothetical protein M3Y96_01043700 [Aphelenchoides besseyi]